MRPSTGHQETELSLLTGSDIRLIREFLTEIRDDNVDLRSRSCNSQPNDLDLEACA